MAKTVALTIAALILVGCSDPTEEERLAKFRGSVRYKVYRVASEKTTKIAVAQYNKTAGQPVDGETVHATLGILWFVLDKSRYSFIEADIRSEAATGDVDQLSLCLQSVALHKMGYPDLSKSHYDELKLSLANGQGVDANIVETDHKLFLGALILASLVHGDPELAKFGADGLGAISELDYLPSLVRAIVEAKQGNVGETLDQLRELNQSEGFDEHKKAIVADVSAIIAGSPDADTLGDELMEKVVLRLGHRVIDDIFTAENKKVLLDRVKQLPGAITGNTTADQPSADDAGDAADELAEE